MINSVQQLHRVANVYARVVNRKLRCNIPVPVPMTFELEYESMESARCAGRASALMRIDINMTIFRDNVQEMLNEVIPHEMGHLVQFDKFDLKGAQTPGHGVHWKVAMETMGKVPKQHHQMNVNASIAAYKDHVIDAPAINDEVSYAFNGDSYPDGVIIKITANHRFIWTSNGNKYLRKGLTSRWVRNNTWTLIAGHHFEQNPHF